MTAIGFSCGQRALEWSGAITGLLGSALLAANLSISGFGFVVYLASNAFWIGFALSLAAAPTASKSPVVALQTA